MKDGITLRVLFGGEAAHAYYDGELKTFVKDDGSFNYKEITFGTTAEAEAYEKGINDMDGWEGYAVIDGRTPKYLKEDAEKESLHAFKDLKHLAEDITQTQNLLYALRKEYLDECFKDRKEISVPTWMRQAIQYDSAPNIWVDYRHEGAWCVPFALRRELSKEDGNWQYYADANENEEYSNWEDVKDARVDFSDACDFAQWYQEHEIDSFLERVRELAADGRLDGEDGIEKVMEIAEGHLYLEEDFLKTEEILEWVNGTGKA